MTGCAESNYTARSGAGPAIGISEALSIRGDRLGGVRPHGRARRQLAGEQPDESHRQACVQDVSDDATISVGLSGEAKSPPLPNRFDTLQHALQLVLAACVTDRPLAPDAATFSEARAHDLRHCRLLIDDDHVDRFRRDVRWCAASAQQPMPSSDVAAARAADLPACIPASMA